MRRTSSAPAKSPKQMQTFTNTVLAETFQQAGMMKTEAHELLARREPYRADQILPLGIVLITAGADLQADRIEMEIVGWGRDEKSWSLAYVVLPGDPAQRELWDMLDQALSLTFEHPCGRELKIAAACVDSGFHQPTVQQFCNERAHRRVYANSMENLMEAVARIKKASPKWEAAMMAVRC